MLQLGDIVRVTGEPFDKIYPGIYPIEGQAEGGAWKLNIGGSLVDFDEKFLTKFKAEI